MTKMLDGIATVICWNFLWLEVESLAIFEAMTVVQLEQAYWGESWVGDVGILNNFFGHDLLSF